jgi:hypothetical protein
VVKPIYVQDRYKGEMYLGRYACVQNNDYVSKTDSVRECLRVFACATPKYESYATGGRTGTEDDRSEQRYEVPMFQFVLQSRPLPEVVT